MQYGIFMIWKIYRNLSKLVHKYSYIIYNNVASYARLYESFTPIVN